MSKRAQEFFEQLKDGKEPGLIEAIREAVAPLKEIGGQLWDATKPMFDHGRTEAAAALFIGNAHVLYMKGQDGVGQGQDQAQSIEENQQKEIEGREM